MTRVLSAVAWPYTNGPRHIGHVAGFGVPSDVFSRFMRMAGHDVLMVSGTDEHGTPILVLADNEGVPARELVDKYNQVIVDDLCGLGRQPAERIGNRQAVFISHPWALSHLRERGSQERERDDHQGQPPEQLITW